MKRISIILAALMMFMAAALVTLPGDAALASGPKKVTLPPYEEHTLDNGLRVFIMERPIGTFSDVE